MSSRTYLRVLGTLVIAGAVLASVVPWAQAATNYTWNGTSARREWDFKLGSAYKNWLPTTPLPGLDPADTVTFDKIGATNLGQVWLNGDRTVAKVTFGNTTGTYTIMDKAGAPAATLTTAAIEQTAAATGTTANEIAAKLSGNGGLGDELALTVSGGSLKLSGLIGTDVKPVTLSGAVTNGTLEVTNRSATTPNYINAASNITVNAGGTLKVQAKGTTSALGQAAVTLAGGFLSLTSSVDYTPGLLQEFYAGLHHDLDAVQGAILLPLNGAGFDKLGPGGASYVPYNYQWVNSSWLDYPGTPGVNSVANTPTFIDATGTIITDNTGANVHIGNEAASYDHFGLRASGLIRIDTAGNYVFEIGSDDGSKLWIDDTVAIDNDYLQGFTLRTGTIYLEPGYHKFVTAFYERDGDSGFDVHWDGGVGAAMSAIPADRLSQGIPPGGTFSNDLLVTASSSLGINGAIALGDLTLSGGATLTVVPEAQAIPGTSLTFASATFNGSAGSVGVNTPVTLRLGPMTDYSSATVVKSGAGDLILDQTDTLSSAYGTVFQLDAGRIVVIGKAGAQDPLGGAGLALNGGNSIVLSSKSGNWTMSGGLAATADSLLELKKEGTGTVTGATISVQGNLDISPATLLTISARDGYVLDLKGMTTNTGSLLVRDGKVTVDAGGSLATAASITVTQAGSLFLNGAGGLGAASAVSVDEGCYLYLGAAQSNFPQAASGGHIDVASFAAIGGNLTGASYTGGAQNVFLHPDTVLALTAGPEPTRANMGGAVLWRGVTSLTGTYAGLGDNGTTSVYKGAIFDSIWTPSGSFLGTLSEAALANGFEIGLRKSVTFSNTTITAGATHPVEFTGPGRLDLSTGSFTGGTTAKIFLHTGVPQAGADPGTTGTTTLSLNSAGSIKAGMTWTIENGVFAEADPAGIATGATVNIGMDASSLSNHTTGQLNILSGGLMRLGATGWAPSARTSFSDTGAALYFDFDSANWDTEQLPKNKALELIVANNGAFATGLYLGQNSRLTMPAAVPNNDLTITGGTVGIVPTTGGAAVTDVNLSAPTGTTMRISTAVHMSGINVTLGASSPQRLRAGSGGAAADMALVSNTVNGSILFLDTFRAGRLDILSGLTYFSHADVNVLGDLDVHANVLYLGGGGSGSYNGAQTERLISTTGQAADRVAGRIILRDLTRLEMGIKDVAARDPVTNRVHITQPIVIDGNVNPADKRSIWISRIGGTVALPVTLTDVTLNNGGVFAVDNSGSTGIYASLKLAGTGTATLFSAFDVVNLTRDASLPAYDGTNPAIVNWGRVSEGVLSTNVFGTIGQGTKVNVIKGNLLLRNGSRLDGIIDTSTAAAGGDSYVTIWAGRDGNPANRLAGTGTIILGRTPVGPGAVPGPEDVAVYLDETATGTAPNINIVNQTIRVINDATPESDGVVRADRQFDSSTNGYGRFTDVRVESGAVVDLQSWNEQNLVADFRLVAPSATVNQSSDGNRIFIGNVTGTGSEELVLTGTSSARLMGAITNATLRITATAPVYLADLTAQFGAGNTFSTGTGGTVNVAAEGAVLDLGSRGAGGTGGLGPDTVITLSSGGALKGRVNEVAAGLPEILATHAATVNVDATGGRILFEKNTSATPNNGYVHFPNVNLADVAHLRLNQQADSPNGIFDLKLAGSASLASENTNNVWLGNVTAAGGTLSWLQHPADVDGNNNPNARDFKLAGTLSNVTVSLDRPNTIWELTSKTVGGYSTTFNLGNCEVDLLTGTSLDVNVDPGAGTLRSATLGGPPINIRLGSGGTPSVTAATHIVLGQGNTVRGFAAEVASGPQVVNHIYANVDIATTGRVEGDFANDAALYGFPFFHNVNLASGARVDLARVNGSVVADLKLAADGFASNTSGGASIFVADVTGTGGSPSLLSIDGVNEVNLVGTLANANVDLIGTGVTYMLDMTPTSLGKKFVFGSGVVNAKAGTLQVGGTKAAWTMMGTPNVNFDPGVGTINQTAGAVVLHTGQNGSLGATGWGAGLTLNKDGDAATTLRIAEVGPCDTPLQNVFRGRVNINVTSSLAADRDIDLQTSGTGYFRDVHIADGATLRLQSLNDQAVKADIFLDGAGTGRILNDSSSTKVFLGNATGAAGDLVMVGNSVTHAVGNLATNRILVGEAGTAGSLTLDPTVTLNLTAGFDVAANSTLRVDAAVAGAYNVQAGGLLIIGDAGFTGAVTKIAGAQVGLAANAPYTENAAGASILIGVPEYSALLTLTQNDTNIGAIMTDRAGIISTLAGGATQINFAGGTTLLHVGKDGLATPVVTGGRSVTINRNVVFHSANDYINGTTIGGGKTTVLHEDALGSGSVAVNGGELEVWPAGLSASAVAMGGGTLTLHGDMGGNMTLGGGTVAAVGDVRIGGNLTDGGNMTLRASAGNTLTFAGGLALTADRQWTVPTGTVTFEGNVTAAQNLTKVGAGTLRLGGAAIGTLTVGGGIGDPGGMVVVASDAALPTTVIISDEAAYGVGADHGYAEVDLSNSFGCIAIGADTAQDLTMQNEWLSLGASTDAVYSGTLTPYDNGSSPVYYQLGGGGATLTVQSALVEGASETGVRIGREVPGVDDITHQGVVILDAANTFMGYLDIYGYAGITSGPAGDELNRLGLGGIERPVRVFTGGSLDLGGVTVPEFHNISLLEGGGVSSNDYVLTASDIGYLFVDAAEIVIGGSLIRSGVTTVEDGALAGPIDFRKIGPNEVVLADPGGTSANHDVGNVTVEAGTLTITELTSLGFTGLLTVEGSGTMNFAGTGSTEDLAAEVRVDDAAALQVADGLTVRATGLRVLSNAARITLTGGGTLDVGDTTVIAPVDPGAEIEITGNSTFVSRYGNTQNMQANLFRVRGGSTLNFATADFVNQPTGHVQNQSIGWLYPGATLELGPGQDLGRGEWQTCFGNPGLTLDVDPATYEQGVPLAPYVIRVGANSRLDFWNGSTTSSLRSASFADATGIVHRPVAYVRKEGGGTMVVQGSTGYDPNDAAAARLFHWTVAAGTLDVGENYGLGADAYQWAFDGKRPTIANQHLEGIVVEGGATLSWNGQHGFLPASVYGGLPAGEGNGWGPGEFVVHDGATIQSIGAGLELGLACTGTGGTDRYLAYPTVTGAPGSTPSITVVGKVNFRSGIDVDPATSGLINLTVNGTSLVPGNVRLSSDLPAGVGGVVNPGIDKIANLTVGNRSTVVVANTHANLASTANLNGTLRFDPGAGRTIGYGSNVATMTQTDGKLVAASGTTDMGNTIVEATYSGTPVPPTSFLENIDDNFYMKVDGTELWRDTTWDAPTQRTVALTPGWHDIEIRAGNYGGPGGAYAWGDFGFGYDPLGRGTTTRAEYTIPVDDGMMSLLRTMSGGTWVPGLTEGRITGDGFNMSTPNPGGAVTLSPVMAESGQSPPWGEYQTWIYTGQIYVAPVVPQINVSAGAELRLRGFTGMGIADIRGKLVLGGATSTTQELRIPGTPSAPTGTVDLTTGNLVVDYSPAAGTPYDTMAAWVEAGLNAGGNPWTGSGITSSTAAEDPDGVLGVGIIDNTDPDVGGFTVFEGVAVDASSILVKSTYWGDANLDGVVDANDYDQIDKYFLFPPAKYTWATGDFNFDGIIDANDYDKIDRSFLFQGDPLGGGSVGGGGAAPVTTPEPATLALLGLGALAALAGRRRSR